VAEGITVGVVCTSGTNCVGSTSFDFSDNEDAGPWTVELILVEGVVSAWQLEVLTSTEAAGTETLPAQ
jgi:hypothetical protein